MRGSKDVRVLPWRYEPEWMNSPSTPGHLISVRRRSHRGQRLSAADWAEAVSRGLPVTVREPGTVFDVHAMVMRPPGLVFLLSPQWSLES